jgi:hypothetical protein
VLGSGDSAMIGERTIMFLLQVKGQQWLQQGHKVVQDLLLM